MDRREYHERYKNKDRALSGLAEAQPNEIRYGLCYFRGRVVIAD